jgi:hypothetical protein
MGKGKFERFSLAAIADALDGSDIATARSWKFREKFGSA